MRTIVVTLIILLLVNVGWTQEADVVKVSLDRLRAALDRTASLLTLLPNADIRNQIQSELMNAEREYQDAVRFYQNGNYRLAQLHIRIAFKILHNLQKALQNSPFFRIKFREHVDTRIQQAELIVSRQKNDESLYLLNRARFFRQKAYLAANQNKWFASLEYFRLALFFADKAIEYSARNQRQISSERLLSEIQETEMILAKAEDLIQQSKEVQYRRMVQEARRELRNIRNIYEKGEYLLASKKLMTLQRAIFKLIDYLEKMPESELDRIKMDLDALNISLRDIQANQLRNNKPVVNQLVRQMSKLLQEAERDIQRGDIQIARQKMRMANRMLLKIYRSIDESGFNSKEEISRQIQDTYTELESLKPRVAGTPNEFLLSIIEEFLEKASRDIERGHLISASKNVQISNHLILKLNKYLLLKENREANVEEVKSNLRRLQELLQRLQSGGEVQGIEQQDYESALKLYQMAERAFNDRNYELCAELTNLAMNLLTK